MEPLAPSSPSVAVADFDEPCRSLSPRLIGSLVLQTGDRVRAEDVAQEALARAWMRWDEVSAMANPNGWIYTVAFNLARSGRRRQASESRANLRSVSGAATSGTDADVADRLALDGALRAMSPKQRAVIVLRFYASLNVAETAQVMGCAEGTVKSLTSRALDTLRSVLQVESLLDATKGEAS
jgi:RNA polymerase sigma-70 factor (sigma-E family)